MDMEVIKTNKAPAAFGPFCQAVKSKGFIFTSGILPLDPLSGKKVEGGIEEETKQTIENINEILKAAKCSLQNVIRVTIFLTDMNDFDKVNSIYSHHFSEPYPARAAIGVNALAKDAMVEIQAIAVCPE
jgi:2-iminobutanoate/2-iminopropanoate deaminase